MTPSSFMRISLPARYDSMSAALITLRSWASTKRWLNTENWTVRCRTSSAVAEPSANQRV